MIKRLEDIVLYFGFLRVKKNVTHTHARARELHTHTHTHAHLPIER